MAQQLPSPELSQLIVTKSNEAFTLGAEQALVVSAIIMAASAVLTLFILPQKIRPHKNVEN